MTLRTLSGGGLATPLRHMKGPVEDASTLISGVGLNRVAIQGKPGACWFRRESTCPFKSPIFCDPSVRQQIL